MEDKKSDKKVLKRLLPFISILFAGILCIIILSVCLGKSNSRYHKINGRYNTLKSEFDNQSEAFERQIEDLKQENESVKNELTNKLSEAEKEKESLSAQVKELESVINTQDIKIPVDNDKKVVFLTFDDGPSNLTPQFIDTLKRYNVNATFFVTYQPQFEETYRKIIEAGNTIQIHTATHDYNSIYSSVSAYVEDFTKAYDYVCSITGTKPEYFRFPGGSTNSYGKSIVKSIARTMSDKGFQFVDWNVSVGDGSASATKDSIITKITAESQGKNHIVMLAHDSETKSETLAALPEIIEYYQNNGYEFRTISNNVDMEFAQFIDFE